MINCPFCKAELPDTFIAEAFMEIPITSGSINFESDVLHDPRKIFDISTLAVSSTTNEYADLYFSIHDPIGGIVTASIVSSVLDPQGETISNDDYKPLPVDVREVEMQIDFALPSNGTTVHYSEQPIHFVDAVKKQIDDAFNYGAGYIQIDMGKATHIPFTATRDIPCNLDAFEWSPEAVAYVEKARSECECNMHHVYGTFPESLGPACESPDFGLGVVCKWCLHLRGCHVEKVQK
jgi:hypothetical protein